MYLSIILLPLLSSLLATNRKTGYISGPILSVICQMVSAILTLIVFFEVGLNGAPVILSLGNWIDNGNLLIEWSLLFDTLTVSMYQPVCIISFLIQIYSLEYMGSDPHASRFFSLLSLFSFAMLMLVSGENLLILLQGKPSTSKLSLTSPPLSPRNPPLISWVPGNKLTPSVFLIKRVERREEEEGGGAEGLLES